jgi:hypothetical protein
MFVIRRRSTGKIIERGFKNREEAKINRNPLNAKHYKNNVPLYNREYYVARSNRHRLGQSK